MRTLRRMLMLAAGIVCLLAGAVFLPLPTPIGLPLLALGTGLMLLSSAAARRWLREFRRRHPALDARLGRIERYLPAAFARGLRLTRPWRPRPPSPTPPAPPHEPARPT